MIPEHRLNWNYPGTQEEGRGEIKKAAECEWRMFPECIVPARLD